jgi:hypothetical protein
MRVRPLSDIQHPDFNEVVVHFTGRAGTSAEAEQRLGKIVDSGKILATIPYGNDLGAACFTESTAAGVSWLIANGHFVPYGVAFTKSFLFAHGGGPALVVRGDEWQHVRDLPPALRARAVRLWPGAEANPGEPLPSRLRSRSEWLSEREWRVPARDGTPALSFDTDDIAFLVVPTPEWIKSTVRLHVKAGHTDLARRFADLRWISMAPTGEITGNNGVRLSTPTE